MSVWSFDPVTNQFPFLFHFEHVIAFLCPYNVVAQCPLLGSHIFNAPSFPPDATRPKYGCHSTVFTSPECPLSVCSVSARAKSTIFTDASSLPVANFKSDLANEIDVTGSLCT